METQKFMKTVLPSEGYLCAVGIKDGVAKHTFTTGLEALLEAAAEYAATGHDAYFACHSFSNERRTQASALQTHSFYLDLDCGEQKAAEGKGYATKPDAITALKQFCKTFAIPKPYIVDSGRGLHVYWMTDDPMTRDEWKPVARALKRAAVETGLLIDASVPADSARILRVPGTRNFKDKKAPLDVLILHEGRSVTLEQMRAAFKSYETMTVDKSSWKSDATTRALMGNYESNFGKIARLSLKGHGCNQIRDTLEHQETVAYDFWLAALTIAARCNDAPTAIHKMSSGHPDYDYTATEEKAEEAANSMGPRTCAWYKLESGSKLCEGCEHKITSPIQLGRVVIEAIRTEPVNETNETDETDETDEVDAPRTYALKTHEFPELPTGYFWGQHGGIYKRDKKPSGEFDEVLVIDDPLYVIKRVQDPVDGASAVLRLHPPHDAVVEFAVPLKDLQAADKFRDIMSHKGIVANKRGMDNLMTYTTSFVKFLRSKLKAEEARTQFGWADGNSKFILGTREITVKGEGYSPSSSTTEYLAPLLAPKGNLEDWRRAFNMYSGKPNCGAHVAALMSTFGAPILRFSGLDGVLISLVNDQSGTGKTSILHLINSVWGHPSDLILLQKDTVASKQHRMGILNALPVTMDEITNARMDEVSDLAYGITHGRGRNRMRVDTNNERVNNTRWSTIAIATGNASVAAKLQAYKGASEGEQMRVMEFELSLVQVEDAARLMRDLTNNYGVAGGIYAKALVTNKDKILPLIDRMTDKLTEAANGHTRERFWIRGLACNLVGGHIAQRLGLHDYDMEKLFDWCVSQIHIARDAVKDGLTSAADVLGEYMLDNFSSVLVVDANKVHPITGLHVWKPANGAIAARYDAHLRRLSIPKKALKDYCVSRQIDISKSLKAENPDYAYVGIKKQRIAAGTGVVAPPMDAFTFDVSAAAMSELQHSLEHIGVPHG